MYLHHPVHTLVTRALNSRCSGLTATVGATKSSVFYSVDFCGKRVERHQSCSGNVPGMREVHQEGRWRCTEACTYMSPAVTRCKVRGAHLWLLTVSRRYRSSRARAREHGADTITTEPFGRHKLLQGSRVWKADEIRQHVSQLNDHRQLCSTDQWHGNIETPYGHLYKVPAVRLHAVHVQLARACAPRSLWATRSGIPACLHPSRSCQKIWKVSVAYCLTHGCAIRAVIPLPRS